MTTSIYANGLLHLPREISGATRILLKAKATRNEVVFTLIPVYETEYINYGYKPNKTIRSLAANISFRQALVETKLKAAEVSGEYEISQQQENEYVFTVDRGKNHAESGRR